MTAPRYPVEIGRAAGIALHEARGREAALRGALAAAALPWPTERNRLEGDGRGREVVRLGPTRVLLLSPLEEEAATTARLEHAFAATPEADVALVTDMHVAFVIGGAGAQSVLRQGAPLDLDREAFPPRTMTGTELFGIGVILGRDAGPDERFRLLVERSHAGYVEDWLATAAGLPSAERPGVMRRPPARIRPG